VRKGYILEQEDQDGHAHAHRLPLAGGEGQVVAQHVAAAELEDRQFQVEVGQPLDVSVAHWLPPEVPLDSHFSKIFSIGWLLYGGTLTPDSRAGTRTPGAPPSRPSICN
jgi:hypothetical protein